jgi:hypothetical protein
MPTAKKSITEADPAAAAGESRSLDFKESFDPNSGRDWVELVKDIAAMANSGGGHLVFGVKDNGALAAGGSDAIARVDPAVIADKLFKYSRCHFAEFELTAAQRHGASVTVLAVGPTDRLIVFTKPGTYPDGPSQGRAFSQGTVYFRHGAKSEPATSEDVARFVDRRLAIVRRQWLAGIRTVVEAPAGAELAIIEGKAIDAEGRPTRVRLSNEPGAPVFGKLDPDETHPYRQTELIAEMAKRLPKATTFNSFDSLAVRTAHGIDPKRRPEFVHQSRFGSPQYSPEFVDWMLAEFRLDQRFFDKARQKHYELTHQATNT